MDMSLVGIVYCQLEVSAMDNHSSSGVLPTVVRLSEIVKPR